MKFLIPILEFLSGVVLVFAIGSLIAHLFKIDEFLNNSKDDSE